MAASRSKCYCCVPGCCCCTQRQPYLSFHSFPVNGDIRIKWIQAIWRDEWPNLVIRKTMLVCSRHFTSEDYVLGCRVRRLNSEAVPSIFPWNNPTFYPQKKSVCGRPNKLQSRQCKNKMMRKKKIVKVKLDHDYAMPPSTAPSAAMFKVSPDTAAKQQTSPADAPATQIEMRKPPPSLPLELPFLTKETADFTSAERPEASLGPSAQPPKFAPVLGCDHQHLDTWSCSEHQKLWMMTELQDLGLWPGSHLKCNLKNSISLWRLPPHPELINIAAELPSPNFFQLHPFFIWKPENGIMANLRNNFILPCLGGCPYPQVVSAGVGRPQVIVGTSGQYYLMSSQLCCNTCQTVWFADSPRWLEKLPTQFTNLLPACLTYTKAICKSVVEELRCSSKSPADMADQLNELMYRKYECAHLAYLQAIESPSDTKAAIHGQNAIRSFVRRDDTPHAFGSYDSTDGWCGVTVSSHCLTGLLDTFRHQEPFMTVYKMMIGQEKNPLLHLRHKDTEDTEEQPGMVQAQQLWHTFTAGDKRISVPVVTMNPAFVSPPAPDPSTLTQGSAEKRELKAIKKHKMEKKVEKVKTTTAWSPLQVLPHGPEKGTK